MDDPAIAGAQKILQRTHPRKTLHPEAVQLLAEFCANIRRRLLDHVVRGLGGLGGGELVDLPHLNAAVAACIGSGRLGQLAATNGARFHAASEQYVAKKLVFLVPAEAAAVRALTPPASWSFFDNAAMQYFAAVAECVATKVVRAAMAAGAQELSEEDTARACHVRAGAACDLELWALQPPAWAVAAANPAAGFMTAMRKTAFARRLPAMFAWEAARSGAAYAAKRLQVA